MLTADEIAEGLGDRFRLLTGGRRTAVPAPADAPGADRLELGPPRRARPAPAPAALGVRRRLDARRGRGGHGRPGDRRRADRRRRPGSTRSTASAGSSTARSSSPSTAAGRGSGCSRRSASTRATGSSRAASRPSSATGTWPASGAWPRRRGPALDGAGMLAALEQVDAEIDNIRAALDWAFEVDPEAAIDHRRRSLGPYWRARSMGTEGLDRLAQAIDALRALPETAGRRGAPSADVAVRLLAIGAREAAMTEPARRSRPGLGRRGRAARPRRAAIRLTLSCGPVRTGRSSLMFAGRPGDDVLAGAAGVGRRRRGGRRLDQPRRSPPPGRSEYLIGDRTSPRPRSGSSARRTPRAPVGNPFAIGLAALARGRYLGLLRQHRRGPAVVRRGRDAVPRDRGPADGARRAERPRPRPAPRRVARRGRGHLPRGDARVAAARATAGRSRTCWRRSPSSRSSAATHGAVRRPAGRGRAPLRRRPTRRCSPRSASSTTSGSPGAGDARRCRRSTRRGAGRRPDHR